MATNDKLRDFLPAPHLDALLADEISPLDAMIGRQIRQRRELLGRTQADLAAFLGMKRPNATKIESGETPVTAANLKRIAGWLGVDDLNYFVNSSQPDPEETTIVAYYRSMPAEARWFLIAAMQGVALAIQAKPKPSPMRETSDIHADVRESMEAFKKSVLARPGLTIKGLMEGECPLEGESSSE